MNSDPNPTTGEAEPIEGLETESAVLPPPSPSPDGACVGSPQDGGSNPCPPGGKDGDRAVEAAPATLPPLPSIPADGTCVGSPLDGGSDPCGGGGKDDRSL